MCIEIDRFALLCELKSFVTVAMLVKYTSKKSTFQRPTLESVKRRLFHDDDTTEPTAKRVRYADIET